MSGWGKAWGSHCRGPWGQQQGWGPHPCSLESTRGNDRQTCRHTIHPLYYDDDDDKNLAVQEVILQTIIWLNSLPLHCFELSGCLTWSIDWYESDNVLQLLHTRVSPHKDLLPYCQKRVGTYRDRFHRWPDSNQPAPVGRPVLLRRSTARLTSWEMCKYFWQFNIIQGGPGEIWHHFFLYALTLPNINQF